MRSVLLILLTIPFLPGQTWAQPQVREADHFWRKRVVNRISLVEKINQPLVYHESQFYNESSRFSETDGLVASLINGVKQGKYVAYHPENDRGTLSYEELLARMREFENALVGEEPDEWTEAEEKAEFDAAEEDEWADTQWEVLEDQEWATPFEAPDPSNGPGSPEAEKEPELAPYEEVIHMVEDWIFDKVRSEMVQRISFFEVIWADPSGALPEKVLARFRWEDVRDQLDQTKWKSRFNDAEARSLREIFELRLFNSFIIDIGGEPVRSLQEAERRRQELIEFEHHLWSY